jgi:hypothetical protein
MSKVTLSATGVYKNVYNPNGVSYDLTTLLQDSVDRQVIYNPYAIPGYPKQLGNSSLTTDLFGTKGLKLREPVGYVSFEDGAPLHVNYTASGSFPINWSLPDLVEPNWANLDTLELCATKLRSNIYQAQSGSQSGVFLGEIAETLALVKHPVRSLGKAFRELRLVYRDILRLGYSRTSRKFLQAWSNEYLKFTFGVLPLINDVDNHVNRINDILEKRQFKQVGARIAADDVLLPQFGVGNDLNYQVRYNTRLDRWYEETAIGRALVEILPDGPKFSTNNFGLRINDFVPTVYELIPFSFVVDYFSNLNNLVNAQFIERRSVIFGYVTQLRRHNAKVSYSNFTRYLSSDQSSIGASSPLEISREYYVRQDIGKIPDSISLSLPSTRQLVNLAALVSSLTPLVFKD